LLARPLWYNSRLEPAGEATQLGVFLEAETDCHRLPAAFRAREAAGRLSREAPAEDSNSIAGSSDSLAASFSLGLSEILPEPVEDLGAIMCGRTSDRPFMAQRHHNCRMM